MRHLKSLPLLLLAASVALPLAAHAGGKAAFTTGDSTHQATMTLIWRDAANLRMQVGNQPGYFVVHQGKAYSVSEVGGTPRVMDMQGMMQMMLSIGGKAAQKQLMTDFGHVGSVQATGKTETVAGIEGRVYQMHWTDRDGASKSEHVVLTDNALVVEMTQAYFDSISAMYGSQGGLAFQKGFPGHDRGLLRVGDSFRLKSITNFNPPASTFELPAKPMDMQELMRGLGGMGGLGRH